MSELQPIETAPKDGGVKIGWQSGCTFAMVWRLPAWFAFFDQAYPQQRKTGGWVVQGYGIVCYAGDGRLDIVEPTHWMPRPDAPKPAP